MGAAARGSALHLSAAGGRQVRGRQVTRGRPADVADEA